MPAMVKRYGQISFSKTAIAESERSERAIPGATVQWQKLLEVYTDHGSGLPPPEFSI